MRYKSKCSKKCIEEIQKLTKENVKFTVILKQLKPKYKYLTYEMVNYHGGKVYTPKQIRTIKLNFIESTTELCKEMTDWVRILKREYCDAEELKDRSRFAFHINTAFRNFVDLLKTPAIQTTQVNILQQELQRSLEGVIHDRPIQSIKVTG